MIYRKYLHSVMWVFTVSEKFASTGKLIITEVTGSNPVEALIFFRLLLSNCLNWKIY